MATPLLAKRVFCLFAAFLVLTSAWTMPVGGRCSELDAWFCLASADLPCPRTPVIGDCCDEASSNETPAAATGADTWPVVAREFLPPAAPISDDHCVFLSAEISLAKNVIGEIILGLDFHAPACASFPTRQTEPTCSIATASGGYFAHGPPHRLRNAHAVAHPTHAPPLVS